MAHPMHKDEKEAENLEKLSIKELESFLEQEFSSNEEPNIEYLQRLVKTLDQKQHYSATDAHQALEIFKSAYLSESEENSTPHAVQVFVKKPRRKCFRILWAAAILAALVLAVMAVAYAANVNIFDIFGFWTDKQFYFGSQYVQESDQQVVELPELPADREYSSLEEVFNALKIRDRILPTWQPEGYKLAELKTSDVIPGQLSFDSYYQNADKHYSVHIVLYSDIASVSDGFYEKDDSPMELYSVAGHSAYGFSNLENYVIAWVDGHYRITISGNIDEDLLIKMAESIYE